MNITLKIDDLPDSILIEILCRLSGNKFLFECKCVSKRWCTLISNSCFIKRFVCLQDEKQTPIISTLIDRRGGEFLGRMSSSAKPLTPLFERIMTADSLYREPVVVATYNDLILCCKSEFEVQRDYYICNPYTRQWVALPPSPTAHLWFDLVTVTEGLIADPYYKQDGGNTSHFSIDADYRCRVVRLLLPYKGTTFIAEVFSSETGEWRLATVSSPQEFHLFRGAGCTNTSSFAYNGMLYWMFTAGSCTYYLIALDPFMISNNSSSSSDGGETVQDYKCRFIQIDESSLGKHYLRLKCFGVHGGCIRLCEYYHYYNEDYRLCVWDLKEEDLMAADGAGKLCLKPMRVCPRDEEWKMVDSAPPCTLIGVDPSDEGIVYGSVNSDDEIDFKSYIAMCNTRTGRWTKMDGKSTKNIELFPFVLPWWPTPVPRLGDWPPSK